MDCQLLFNHVQTRERTCRVVSESTDAWPGPEPSTLRHSSVFVVR